MRKLPDMAGGVERRGAGKGRQRGEANPCRRVPFGYRHIRTAAEWKLVSVARKASSPASMRSQNDFLFEIAARGFRLESWCCYLCYGLGLRGASKSCLTESRSR